MSETDLYSKRLGEREAAALNVLQVCGLTHITVPYRIEGSMLSMTRGTPVDIGSFSIARLFKDCLKELHSVKSLGFSPCIYAFYGVGLLPFEGERYGAYLKRQVDSLQTAKANSTYKIINAVFSYCSYELSKGIARHRAHLDSLTSFSLLHGDLHYGNILELNGVYKLIDFEYLMFGPPQVELSFLLFWHYISGEKPFPAPAQLRQQIAMICAEARLDAVAQAQIEEVFFPLFLFLAADSLAKGRYANPIPFQKGLKAFYENTLPEL